MDINFYLIKFHQILGFCDGLDAQIILQEKLLE